MQWSNLQFSTNSFISWIIEHAEIILCIIFNNKLFTQIKNATDFSYFANFVEKNLILYQINCQKRSIHDVLLISSCHKKIYLDDNMLSQGWQLTLHLFFIYMQRFISYRYLMQCKLWLICISCTTCILLKLTLHIYSSHIGAKFLAKNWIFISIN